MKNINEALNWRYATKKFDINKKIDALTLDTILESLRLSPSSYGLQPWKFFIINNKDVRAKIQEAGYNQSQITEASHLIVFANKKNMDDGLIDEYLDFISKEGNVKLEQLQGFGGMMKGSLAGKSDEVKRAWASHQVYLAAGVFLTSCALLGVDACPMEGFNNLKVDEILNLNDLNLESKFLVTLGYRSADDSHSLHEKVRFPKEYVFVEIN